LDADREHIVRAMDGHHWPQEPPCAIFGDGCVAEEIKRVLSNSRES
jgi:hypothetical protein